jgi:hypothetical protein
MTTKIINKKRSEFILLDNKGSTAVCIIIYENSPFVNEVIVPFETILYQFYFIHQVHFYKFTENSKIIAPNFLNSRRKF